METPVFEKDRLDQRRASNTVRDSKVHGCARDGGEGAGKWLIGWLVIAGVRQVTNQDGEK